MMGVALFVRITACSVREISAWLVGKVIIWLQVHVFINVNKIVWLVMLTILLNALNVLLDIRSLMVPV